MVKHRQTFLLLLNKNIINFSKYKMKILLKLWIMLPVYQFQFYWHHVKKHAKSWSSTKQAHLCDDLLILTEDQGLVPDLNGPYACMNETAWRTIL